MRSYHLTSHVCPGGGAHMRTYTVQCLDCKRERKTMLPLVWDICPKCEANRARVIARKMKREEREGGLEP